MPIKMLFKTMLFSSFLISTPVVSCEEIIEDNWVESCPNNDFCFIHPKDLIRFPMQVIDSNAGQFQNKDLILFFDLGWYATHFPELTTATSEFVIVDGREGKILQQDNKMALSVLQVEGKKRFSMLLTFNKQVSIEQGKRIFSSIRFKTK